MKGTTSIALLSTAFGAMLSFAGAASAATCVGACGTSGADGIVTTSPDGGDYNYISTYGGESGAGQLDGVGGTNGSLYTSTAFAADAGDTLEFFFNFVTSDGAGFSDYAWAELVDDSLSHVAWLFTGRTQPSGDTSPGFSLPRNDSILSPGNSPIIAGAPMWSPLGENSSGRCYDAGCGYTGWIKSEYAIASAGTYSMRFGVSNVIDTGYDTGLAFDGAKIAGVSIDPTSPSAVPLPASALLLGAGLTGLAGLRRRRRAA